MAKRVFLHIRQDWQHWVIVHLLGGRNRFGSSKLKSLLQKAKGATVQAALLLLMSGS